jgi:hypothetical protein
MKKILGEWKKYLSESLESNKGNSQIDNGNPLVTLYHVGWKHPSMPFEYISDNVFTGEPAPFSSYERPLGNEALYCTTSRSHAMEYKKYSDLPYLYEFEFPTSELAGILDPKYAAPEEIQEKYIKKWKSGNYGARFHDLRKNRGAIEVGIYDTSLIKVISSHPLFEESDIDKHLEEIVDELQYIEDVVNSVVETGKYIYDYGYGVDTVTPTEVPEIFQDFEQMFHLAKENSKERAKFLASKDTKPREVEEYIERFNKAKNSFLNSQGVG